MNDFFIGSYYDPEENKKYGEDCLVEGKYPCHIVNYEIKVRTIQEAFKAKLYIYYAMIDRTDNSMFVDVDNKKVNTSKFGGITLTSLNLFYFLTPTTEQEREEFHPNPGGNRNYLEFCGALGIDCPVIEIDVNGETRKVKALPILSGEDIVGKPIIANLKYDKAFINKKGKKVKPLKIFYQDLWDTNKKGEKPARIPFDI